MSSPYDSLSRRMPRDPWIRRVCALSEQVLAAHTHGDLPKWREALAALPRTPQGAQLDQPVPSLGGPAADEGALRETLMAFHPWRKGPLRLGGVNIDTEWRSDWKWDRVARHVDLRGLRVLDIGCGNGYFGLRMLGAGADLVVGFDPTLVFVMQWLACRHFSGDIPNYVLPLGIEELPDKPAAFGAVFSMGVLYHRRDPLRHLRRLHSLLANGGCLVVETLVLPEGRTKDVLVPAGRYARMRNVRAIPGTRRLMSWIAEAGFGAARLVDVTPTTVDEQRTTPWMHFESLGKALDPDDPGRTVEGHPAPVRAVVTARS